jgi:hypothetical protein
MNGEKATHEGVDAAVIGIAPRFERRKGKAGIGSYKSGIE